MATAQDSGKRASWGVITMLAAAQFIMVLDTTVMNVSISQVVADLDTTVVGLQSAITIYTLVMAAFMLIGGKIGDRWGAKRAFAVGLLVYGIGSLTTAFSPNLGVLLVGWSFIEGFGAIMVIPAIAALTAGTYHGHQRALAYGILGGVAGASAAAGPLIGGWVTANYTWRYVFAAETVVVLFLMLFLKLIPSMKGRPGKLDLVGAILSAAGLGAAVFGILRSSQWGWVTPSANVPTVNGQPLAPLGLSPALWLMLLGGVLLVTFQRWEERVKARAEEPLVDLDLLDIPPMRAGLITLASQQFIIMATFFILPLYLQTVLGFDALETGITILPLSVGLFLFALGGSSLSGKYSARRIVSVGLAAMLVGEVLLLAFVGPDLRNTGFSIALALVGAGLGLLASQLGNVIMSSVGPERGGEAGGLQGTAQNLGASLGTALIGSILIASLAANFTKTVVVEPSLSEPLKQEAAAAAQRSANFLSTQQVMDAALEAGVSEEEAQALADVYAEAQLKALRASLAGIALFALVALVYVRRLPEATVEAHGPPETVVSGA